jgi:flagellar motor switch protein FliM
MAEEETAPAAKSTISDEEVAALLEKNGKEADGVRPYDFTAQRISRTQLPLLEMVSKTFAARAAASLSSLLGRDASVQFEAMESVKCADVQAALPVPGTLAVIRMKPLNGFAYVSLEPQLLLTLLDGFFGGTGRANTDTQAAAAPAAQRFLALMLKSFTPDIAIAWQPVTPVELEVVKQETNPRLLQLGGPMESVICCKFTVEFAARSGTMSWLLPEALIAPIRDALSGESGSAPARKQEAWGPSLGTALADAQMDTRAVLAEAKISLRELVALSPGDIIPIDAPQEVTLLSGDVPLYTGRFGVSQGRNALKIVSGVSA